MKKILIVCSHFFDDTDANAICVRNIVEELKKDNHIWIITDYSEGFDRNKYSDISFSFAKKSLYERITSSNKNALKTIFLALYIVIRRVLNFFVFPNVSPVRSKKVLRLSEKIINQNGIDLFLATYRPFESIQCGIKLRKKYEHLRLIAYHLDNLDDFSFRNNRIRTFLLKKSQRAFTRECASFNKVFITVTSTLSGQNVKKIGLPVYKKLSYVPFDYLYDHHYINICYIGSLDANNRNPQYAFSLIREFNKLSEKKMMVHVWGCVNGLDRIFSSNRDFVIYNGHLSNEYVGYIYYNSDFVLNIGNTVTKKMIPSKLFQIFATNKPIISFVDEDDATIPFLKAYPNSILLLNNQFENSFEAMKKIINQKSGFFSKLDDASFDLFNPTKIAECLINEE